MLIKNLIMIYYDVHLAVRFTKRKMVKLFANRGDTDQTPHSVVSDLGLYSLPVTLLRVSHLQWDNKSKKKKKV